MHTKAIARRKLCTQKLETPMRLHRKVFTHRKPLQIGSFYMQSRSTLLQRNFTQRSLLHTEASTHSKLLHTEKLLYAASFYTQQTFTHKQFLQSFARAEYFFTPQVFTHSTLLHRETFSHSKLLHTEAFTHSTLLHKETFTHSKRLHRKIFTQKNHYAEKLLQRETFKDRCAYTRKLLHRETLHTEAFTHRTLSNLFAQSTYQYYFVLQSPSTTLYYKACTKHCPVLICTTKLAQSTYYILCTTMFSHRRP